MRAHGVLDRVAGLGVSDHIGWDYATDDGFLAPGLAWVAEGLQLGQRVAYISDKSEHWMMDDLRALGGGALRARGRGALDIRGLADMHPAGADGEAQLFAYADLLQKALDDGFAGLRVLTEVTPLVRDPSRRDEHARWERLLDRYMVDHPLSALCAYDRRLIGDEMTAALSCVHPLRRRQSKGSTFALFAATGGMHLDGDVDAFNAPLLDRVLDERPARALVIEIGPEAFLDAASTSVLARHAIRARAEGAPVCIRTTNPTFRRVWDLLGFSEIVPIED